jgi:alanine racemase
MALAPSLGPQTGLDPLVAVADRRGNRIVIDTEAFGANVIETRRLVGEGVRLFQVVKGDGYGLGLERAVAMGLAAGVDGFCAGTPEEALRICLCAPGAFALLFTACVPENLPELAEQGVMLSVNSVEALAAIARSGVSCRIFLDLDCGFGRFGLDDVALVEVLELAGSLPGIIIEGAYTHFGQGDQVTVDRGLAVFEHYLAQLRQRLGPQLITMVAATHTILRRPKLPYNAVDPGRLLYGIVERNFANQFRPVLCEISSRIIQINRLAESQTLTIGYGETVSMPAGGKTGVYPLGWYDGLSLRGCFGHVLVQGKRVPVIARTLLHSVVDLSKVEDARVGDRVILVGAQWDDRLVLDEVAREQGVTATELHFRLAGAITRASPLSRLPSLRDI